MNQSEIAIISAGEGDILTSDEEYEEAQTQRTGGLTLREWRKKYSEFRPVDGFTDATAVPISESVNYTERTSGSTSLQTIISDSYPERIRAYHLAGIGKPLIVTVYRDGSKFKTYDDGVNSPINLIENSQ